MTLVFTNSDFWIETLIFTHTNIAIGAQSTIEISVTRPGALVGICSTESQNNTNEPRDYKAIVTNPANGNLSYGDAVTSIRSRVRNLDGADTNTVVHYVVVMMRKG